MSEFTIIERTVYPEEKTWLIIGNETNVSAEVTKSMHASGADFNVQFGFFGYDSTIDLYGADQFNKFKALVSEVDQFITSLGEPQI